MSQVLAVFGATGQQGGSVITYVLNDPELSKTYKIRAITRDVNSEKAKQLKKKIEVVHGDVLNPSSLTPALHGAHTIFAMTAPAFGPDGLEVEYAAGRAIADVAVAQGASYLIFSTLPAVSELSGGKYTAVTAFDAKAKAEQYIRTLPIKSAFYSPGSFMQNFAAQPFLAPREAPDGTWVLSRANAPTLQLPLLDAVTDTGKFVGAMLADPEHFKGRRVCAAEGLYSLEEIVKAMGKATGKTVVYKQIPADEFRAGLVPMLGEGFADVFVEGFAFGEEFGGYYGPDTDKLVGSAAGRRGRGSLALVNFLIGSHLS